MKLKRLLVEITFDQALKALNLSKSDVGDAAKIKQAFRQAALKAHPDKGGSNEAMRDVNDAYELLQKQGGRRSSFDSSADRAAEFERMKRDSEERKAKEKEIGNKVLESLKSKINYNAFVKYFNSIYNDIFVHKIFNERPSPRETWITSAGFVAEFSNPDRSIVFLIEFSASLSDATSTGSIGSGVGNVSYPLAVRAYGFYNNKKLKITQRDYNKTTNHDVLSSPEIAFPKAKLEKFKGTSVTKVFKKADMITYLVNKLNMPWDGEDARIRDTPKSISIVFIRSVFMKTPAWQLVVYENSKSIRQIPTVLLPETIESAQAIEVLVKAVKKTDDPEQIKEICKDWATKMRNKT